MKATVFTRRDFIDRSQLFVPVYLDGDAPEAQKTGERFSVYGYPSMIVFNAEGTEITRIPNGLNIEAYAEILDLSLSAERSAKSIVAAILAGERVPNDDFRRLAYYSWSQDNEGTLKDRDSASALTEIAKACPPELPVACLRLYLTGLSMTIDALGEEGAAADTLNGTQQREALRKLSAMLNDEALIQSNIDALLYGGTDFVAAVTAAGSAERAVLEGLWLTALEQLADDAAISTTEQLYASYGPVDFLKLSDTDAVAPSAVQSSIRQRVGRALLTTTDEIERHSVIVTAASLLRGVDLPAEADTLLESELASSKQPFYLMSSLASSAEKNGDIEQAIQWRRRAYESSTGESTRFRWGVSYVTTLIKLVPEDTESIESSAAMLFSELENPAEAFYGSTTSRAKRLSKALREWSVSIERQEVTDRLYASVELVCNKIPPTAQAHDNCSNIFVVPEG